LYFAKLQAGVVPSVLQYCKNTVPYVWPLSTYSYGMQIVA
jgi:hypothetical protein